MHWQLGGNFGPILKACEYRWLECFYALAHYIWFEVVTDVADSLANELTLWRVLTAVLIFMMIINFMYWKKQWIKEINITNETLKKIELKVQHLELKINVFTYKAQYDIWPLMQLLKINNESDSESNSPTYSKLNTQRAYLKYFLARTRRKNIKNKAPTYNTEPQSLLSEMNVCDAKAKYISSTFNEKSMQQTNCTEKKLSLTSLEQKRVKTEQLYSKGLKNNSTINLSEEPTTEENLKLYRSSSDSSLNDHLRSTYLGSKKITKINIKPGKLLHRKRISPEIAEKQLKFSISSTNNISSSKNTLFPKFFKQNYHSSYQDDNSKEETHKTLNQVKEKLQCLHSTLLNYPDNFESTTSQSSNNVCDNFIKANTTQDNNNYDCIKNQQGDYNYVECVSLKKSINTHDTSKGDNPDVIKEYKTSKITHHANENDNEKLKKRDNFNNFAASNELSHIHTEDVNNLLESNTTTNRYCVETDETKNILPNHSRIQQKDRITDSDDNQQLHSLVETSKGSDSDNRSISSLIQEALKFKQELLLQIESKKEKDEINIQSTRNESESCDYSNWLSDDSDFEPNSLDKITEESSGSSVVDKKSKTHILITVENCKNQNINNDNIDLLSHCSTNQIVENIISNNKTNSNEILLADREKRSQREPETLLQNTEEIYHLNLSNNLRIDSNFKALSDTSSDTSVNRLLDRLIESERKCKSAKSLTNSKIKEDTADSLNTFIIPHTFFDKAQFEGKQNSLPVEEFGVERHFTEKIDSGIESYENKSFESTSLNTDEIQESEIIQIVCDEKRVKSKKNDEDNLLKKNTTKLGTSEIEDNEISDCLLQKYNSHSMADQHFDKDSVNDDNVTDISRNIDDSTNVVKSMSKLEIDEMKNRNIISKKDAGDFYSDSEMNTQKTAQNSTKNIFPSGDSNSLESNTLSKSAVKLRSNLYHSLCKGQIGSNFQTGFKNSEQCSIKVHKNSSSNLIQKPSATKQLKAKSNLNLTAVECVDDLPTHKRSKSQVISCDIPLMNQNKRAESETIPIQLDSELENHDKKMEKEKENLCSSLEVSKKSFSKPCTPQSSRNCSNDIDNQFQMKKNNSSTLFSKSSSKSSIPISKDSNLENNHNKNDIKRKSSNESVSSKSSTKSCIPILKTRLELVIIDDNDFHPKSLFTGSLKMNVQNFGLEEVINSCEENTEKKENQDLTELIDEKDIIYTNSSGAFELESCSDSHDYVSSYIDTMINDIQLDADTNNEIQIFSEYENELIKHTTSNDQIDPAFIEDKATLIPEQDALVDSLVRHNDDLTNMVSLETYSLELQSASSRVLSYKDSKEIEVLAKPCTLDSSTSMSDVPSLTNPSNSKASELKILEVPEQLTKEEYATLLQLINDHPDFEHLLNLSLQK